MRGDGLGEFVVDEILRRCAPQDDVSEGLTTGAIW